jgi:hypothetical protein
MNFLQLLLIIYVISGFIAYGLSFGFWQNNFPTLAKENYQKDLFESIFVGFFGILGLIGFLCFLVGQLISGEKCIYFSFKIK